MGGDYTEPPSSVLQMKALTAAYAPDYDMANETHHLAWKAMRQQQDDLRSLMGSVNEMHKDLNNIKKYTKSIDTWTLDVDEIFTAGSLVVGMCTATQAVKTH